MESFSEKILLDAMKMVKEIDPHPVETTLHITPSMNGLMMPCSMLPQTEILDVVLIMRAKNFENRESAQAWIEKNFPQAERKTK